MSGLILQSLLAGLTNGLIYALIGLGIAAIFKGSDIVNAMQGEFGTMAAIVTSLLMAAQGWPYWLAGFCGLSVGLIFGVIIEFVLVRPMRRRDAPHDSYLLLTLGLSITFSALILYVAGSESYKLPGFGGDRVWIILNAVVPEQSLWLLGCGVAIILATRWFFGRTSLGLRMMAAAIDADGAATIGVNVPLMRTITFGLGGILGSAAGLLIATSIPLDYHTGLILTLKGFAAAILGGITNPIGAAVGGITIGVLEAASIISISSAYKDVVTFALLIVIMIFLPNGMLGKARRAGG